MEDLQRLKDSLEKESLTLSTCESLTGGLLSSIISSIPGVSSFYKGSIVAYSEEIKKDLLKIPEKVIIENGTVSLETAFYMAKNCSDIMNTDVVISTTGVAGPKKLEAREIGTVFIGISISGIVEVREYHFAGNRTSIREQTAIQAVKFLLEKLNKNSEQSP